MIATNTLKLVVGIASLAALAGAGFAPSAEWNPRDLPISFWCGPPERFVTVERYKEVAEAGFNLLMPPCGGSSSPEQNRKILDTAKAAGLKAFLQDARMPSSLRSVADAKSKIEAIVADYAKHPAFAGYFLGDEPESSAFPGLGEVVAYLREKDPKHPAYMNLFPNYASPEQLGERNYEAYLNRFIERVRPFAVSYDHYHFLKDSDRPGFFGNLAAVRAASIKSGIPFWQIVLAIPHGGYRSLTEAEKRWEAMQTLAYGGKGVLYFTYWQPTDKSFDWGDPIIRADGTRTKQFEEIKRINADMRAVGRYLVDAVPSGVFQSGVITPDGSAREQGTAVSFPGPGDITTGLFLRDTHLYVLFANRDYKSATKTDAVLSAGGRVVEHLDRAKDRWLPVKGEATGDGDLKVRLELAPGDGELYRW